MGAERFSEYTCYAEAGLRAFGLPDEQVKLLVDVGLPTWCAPNMHFGEIGEAWVHLPVIELAGRHFLGLGEDRDGHAVALAAGDYTVWVLAGDSNPMYLAHNVFELSEALHRFQADINAAVANDPTVCRERRVTPKAMAPFVSWISQKNPSAIQTGAFWCAALDFYGVRASRARCTVLKGM